MSEQERPLAEMPEPEAERHRQVQALIQDAIAEVVARSAGRAREEVVADLTRALQARGIGPQPPRWLEAVADEALQGHQYVEDPVVGRKVLEELERRETDQKG